MNDLLDLLRRLEYLIVDDSLVIKTRSCPECCSSPPHHNHWCVLKKEINKIEAKIGEIS